MILHMILHVILWIWPKHKEHSVPKSCRKFSFWTLSNISLIFEANGQHILPAGCPTWNSRRVLDLIILMLDPSVGKSTLIWGSSGSVLTFLDEKHGSIWVVLIQPS